MEDQKHAELVQGKRSLLILASIGVLILDCFFKSSSPDVVLNKGISFGITFGLSNEIFILINIAIYIALCGYLIYGKNITLKPILIALFFASFSNFLDRILWGGVIDYINLGFWLVNLSDIAINTLLLILFLIIIFKWKL